MQGLLHLLDIAGNTIIRLTNENAQLQARLDQVEAMLRQDEETVKYDAEPLG